ncbi:hypothetical protein NDU88_002651 [Pleurodeles waltl]|uniref:Uncharacterized protein n=1 Tax=Pleurodeles waltl TaxID=8319 RepID=A0AAV7MTE1_PLEWA|nr:hypothetical protein NDU88_002651 [Pleurodeles waltl]
MSAVRMGALGGRMFCRQHPRTLQLRTIQSKPPKGKVGPAETLFVFAVFAAGILTPAGWILRHLPEYKQKKTH